MWSYNYLCHFGIPGQKWGVRRYQNPDGTYTEEGKIRYNKVQEASKIFKREIKDNREIAKALNSELADMIKHPESYKETPEQILEWEYGEDWRDPRYLKMHKKYHGSDDMIGWAKKESDRQYRDGIKSHQEGIKSAIEQEKIFKRLNEKLMSKRVADLSKSDMKEIESWLNPHTSYVPNPKWLK